MIATFKIEDAVMQLTTKSFESSAVNGKPVWIALSSGTQCIAGMADRRILNYLDLSHLLASHGIEPGSVLKHYSLQDPWIKVMVAGFLDE